MQTPRRRSRVAHAAEADLQSPLAMAGRQRWREEDSGKFARLREIAEEIAARQEKVLVFTQFKETTAPLAAFLGRCSAARPRAARRDGGEEAQGSGAEIPGGRRRAVLRPLAQGRRVPGSI